VFGNLFISNEIMSAWEGKPVQFSHYDKTYDVAIILGGVTRTNMEPNDRVYFDRGADRILHPLYLFKKGYIKSFIVSGGTGRLTDQEHKEAPKMAEALELFGVPKDKIIIEDQSRNTHENAVYSAGILAQRFSPNPQILLVTSAFHMKRAYACFKEENINCDLLSADFLAHPRQYTPDVLFIPSYEAFFIWNKLMKEWFGIIAYKIAGYI